jgi:hypothetical protein
MMFVFLFATENSNCHVSVLLQFGFFPWIETGRTNNKEKKDGEIELALFLRPSLSLLSLFWISRYEEIPPVQRSLGFAFATYKLCRRARYDFH